MPPPFNANTISRGVSPADFYITSPTALIRLLESNTTTKVLAKPQSRGRDGQQMTLSLGDSIPIPSTTFNSAAAGGIANIPTTAVTYQEVGINLQFTPRVTYQDEIILDNLVLEKSGLGNFLVVAGQSFPTIVRRRSQGSIRLRDGESNLVAGLIRDDDRKTLRGLPGISSIPILRSLFGSTDDQVDQTDIVMIITPHIVRGHELTPEDLRPQYVGAGQSIGGPTPPLISPDAIGAGAAPPVPGQPVATPGQPAVAPVPAPSRRHRSRTAGTELPPVAARAPGVVPIEAVPAGTPAAPAAPARVVLTAPTLSAEGALTAGGGPHTVPITISGAPPLSALTVTITYNPSVLRTPTVTQGSFMSQGAAVPTFVPQVDPNGGRIDLAFVRPAGQATTSAVGTARRHRVRGRIARNDRCRDHRRGHIGLRPVRANRIHTHPTGRKVSTGWRDADVARSQFAGIHVHRADHRDRSDHDPGVRGTAARARIDPKTEGNVPSDGTPHDADGHRPVQGPG